MADRGAWGSQGGGVIGGILRDGTRRPALAISSLSGVLTLRASNRENSLFA